MDLEAILNIAHHGQTHAEFDEASIMADMGNVEEYLAANPISRPPSPIPEPTPPVPRRRRRTTRSGWGMWRLVTIFMSLAGGGGAPSDSYSSQVSSVQYPRAFLWTGLPDIWMTRLDEIMDNRLSVSSMNTVNTAWAKWLLVADHYGWESVIGTDDETRAGKMVTFVLHMLEDTDLVADSISTYVWGLRWAMKLRHQADPVMGVMMWHDFMVGIRVIAHVPGEPRRALPTELIKQIGETIDLNEFWEVQFFFFILVLLFTFSRSECPCPHAFTGPRSWDDNKHWMVRDVMIRMVQGVWVLCVRFKAIKQDPRIERPTARGDGSDRAAAREGGSDWSYVGDCPGSILSPFLWYRRLMAFYTGPRDSTSPFFMAKDRVRPYTYPAAMSDLKTLVRRVQPDDDHYGIHGARVEGYNKAKLVAGEELAVAHGGWKPGSNSKYDRFDLTRVFALSGLMAASEGRSQETESDEMDERAPLAAEAHHVRVGEPRAVDEDTRRLRHTNLGAASVLGTIEEEGDVTAVEVVRGDEARELVEAAVETIASPPMAPHPPRSPMPRARTRISPRRSSPPRTRTSSSSSGSPS